MTEVAVVGGGCYWCLEAFYERIKGVEKVVSGYSGGQIEHPTSMRVYEGDTGHAEVVQVTFDSTEISYREILEIFFIMHDPTTLNRQGNDVGEQYRSVIFYDGDGQREIADEMKTEYAPKYWSGAITTQIEPLKAFWSADETMQDYYARNPDKAYCQVVINPKIGQLRAHFSSRIKPQYQHPS